MKTIQISLAVFENSRRINLTPLWRRHQLAHDPVNRLAPWIILKNEFGNLPEKLESWLVWSGNMVPGFFLSNGGVFRPKWYQMSIVQFTLYSVLTDGPSSTSIKSKILYDVIFPVVWLLIFLLITSISVLASPVGSCSFSLLMSVFNSHISCYCCPGKTLSSYQNGSNKHSAIKRCSILFM